MNGVPRSPAGDADAGHGAGEAIASALWQRRSVQGRHRTTAGQGRPCGGPDDGEVAVLLVAHPAAGSGPFGSD